MLCTFCMLLLGPALPGCLDKLICNREETETCNWHQLSEISPSQVMNWFISIQLNLLLNVELGAFILFDLDLGLIINKHYKTSQQKTLVTFERSELFSLRKKVQDTSFYILIILSNCAVNKNIKVSLFFPICSAF